MIYLDRTWVANHMNFTAPHLADLIAKESTKLLAHPGIAIAFHYDGTYWLNNGIGRRPDWLVVNALTGNLITRLNPNIGDTAPPDERPHHIDELKTAIQYYAGNSDLSMLARKHELRRCYYSEEYAGYNFLVNIEWRARYYLPGKTLISHPDIAKVHPQAPPYGLVTKVIRRLGPTTYRVIPVALPAWQAHLQEAKRNNRIPTPLRYFTLPDHETGVWERTPGHSPDAGPPIEVVAWDIDTYDKSQRNRRRLPIIRP